ncbi:MAG TPA: dTDP-4-dehydrorhamnose reductase [Blastocatellia bacterium]|nr:dTDP-4-dehydrorhamnose reductase [Blastocatellia bacterium]
MISKDETALVTGAGGLLGRFVAAQLRASDWSVVALSHQDLDVSDGEAVNRQLDRARPQVIINCAATTDVDRCEREPEWAERVNVDGPRLLARAANAAGATLVHISTDYVFDGKKDGFYTQEDEPHPLSVYGRTKLAGELAAREELDRAFIVRTSWIFGPGGKNFGSRVLEYARGGAALKGVTDQISIPTYAPDLAGRIRQIIVAGAPGLYHVANSNPGTWYEFARLVLDLAGFTQIEIKPVTRAELAQPAERPRNSAMRCLLTERIGLVPLRDWRAALPEFVRAAC